MQREEETMRKIEGQTQLRQMEGDVIKLVRRLKEIGNIRIKPPRHCLNLKIFPSMKSNQKYEGKFERPSCSNMI